MSAAESRMPCGISLEEIFMRGARLAWKETTDKLSPPSIQSRSRALFIARFSCEVIDLLKDPT